MADLTIRVPSDHVDAVRDGLLHIYSGVAEALHRAAGDHAATRGAPEALRGYQVELRDVEEALDQLGWDYLPATGPVELSTHPALLTDVLHAALEEAGERFDAARERYWRGQAAVTDVESALAAMRTLLTLLEDALGDAAR
jgi:hypothetical protein